jgi:hypothetical protein
VSPERPRFRAAALEQMWLEACCFVRRGDAPIASRPSSMRMRARLKLH